MTYKTGSIGDFMKWTKHVIAAPKAASKMPKRWFDSDKTAEKALATTTSPEAMVNDMDIVAFIDTELGDDLIVSFAVQDREDPTEVETLTLLRTPKYESLEPPEERGVSVSFGRFRDDERELLEEVRYSKNEQILHLATRSWSCDLDVRKCEAEELAAMRRVLRRMNYDGRFRCVGV